MTVPWIEFSADLLFEDEADWPLSGVGPVDLPIDAGGPIAPPPDKVVTRVSVWSL